MDKRVELPTSEWDTELSMTANPETTRTDAASTDPPSSKLPSTVHYEKHNAVAVLFLDNPPVNALGDTVRKHLSEGLARAQADSAIVAVILFGDGAAFSAGADIRQFNTPAAVARPTLHDVITAIETSSKPVVAAIHGFALGAGLELALGCHYRVALAGARLGLPEVNLGLVPSGGGTQRLPRMMDAAGALDMILSGKPIGARRALQAGLVDDVVLGDLLGHALLYATRCASQTRHPVAGLRPVQGFVNFPQERAKVNAKARNALAQHAAIDCVEAATRLPLEAGLDEERRHFDALVAGEATKALQYLFFAEKKATRVMGYARPSEITRVGILGAGTMGSGITIAFANAGYSVTLYERDQLALRRGLTLIQEHYDATVATGKLDATAVQARLAQISPSLRINDLKAVDLVIEAVFEDKAVKQALFRQLDAVCKPGAILATNTAWLNIDDIAAVTRRPDAVIGLHFFSPANGMKLLEVVRGQATSADTIATAMAVAQKIGKMPVLVRVCEGFVGNRMLAGYWREAGLLLKEGASRKQIDDAMTDFGMAAGPFAMADQMGTDINMATRTRLTPVQAASDEGVPRRTVTADEIVSRCVLALINEGARIIDEGIVQRASDVDVVYVHGYGFPGARGGPMFHAQTMGLQATLAHIQALQREHGDHWTPAPLLERLVAEGGTTFP